MTTNETLRKIGLSDGEIKIYLALLKNGKMRPAALSALTKIKRATVYNLANNLVAQGLIGQDVTGKILKFVPLSPDNLTKSLDQTKREIKEKEQLIKNAVSDLELITSGKQYPVPKITFIMEGDLERYLFDNARRWLKEVIASEDGTWWGFQDHTFIENYERWIDHSWTLPESKHPNYLGRIFTNTSKIEQKIQKKYAGQKRQIKYLNGTNFTATTWVCGSSLVMISTRQHPYYLVEINDETLAHNTKEIFKRLWNSNI
jgi:predicted DNA-binding transcriptional regulator